MEKLTPAAAAVLNERFGHDTLLSLATVENGLPRVRIVDGYYEDGAFYVVTDSRSNKMRQIGACPNVAVCGEWFTAHGLGEDLGFVGKEENAELWAKLKTVFAAWIDNGDVDMTIPESIILRVKLTDGLLFSHGTRYDIDFT